MSKSKAAVYCRLACANADNLNTQIDRMVRFAQEQGYFNPVVYRDNGGSGFSYERPAFAQMESDIRAGKIAVVLVRDYLRIGRDMDRTQAWIEGMERLGASIISADHSDELRFVNYFLSLFQGIMKKC